MSSAFYVSEGGRFVSTELTRGPWDPDTQHAGPPAALIGRALEQLPVTPSDTRPGAPGSERAWFIGRITFEILRPVPIAPLTRRGRGRAPRALGGAGSPRSLRDDPASR